MFVRSPPLLLCPFHSGATFVLTGGSWEEKAQEGRELRTKDWSGLDSGRMDESGRGRRSCEGLAGSEEREKRAGWCAGPTVAL